MQVGAGKSEILLPKGFFPAEGFAWQHSSLYARVVLLRGNIDIALLSLELTSIPDMEIDGLKGILNAEIGLAPDNCFICATHTFSAPHILPDAMLATDEDRRKKALLKAAIHKAVLEAAREAGSSLRDTRLKLGQSECHVNCNRDVETEGGWWVATGGKGPSDKTLTALCAEDNAGALIMLIVHYAVQPSVLDGVAFSDTGKAVSSDMAGVMCGELEKLYPGATVVFLPGAAGDQAPIKKAKTLPDEDGLRICGELGHSMAESARKALGSAKHLSNTYISAAAMDCALPAQQMPRSTQSLKPTRKYEYISDGEKRLRAEALRIGPLMVLCVKPELNCVTARQIAEASPFDVTLVATMVNGSAKYMADEGSYDRMTYEAMNSPFAKGAAELFTKHSAAFIHEIYYQKIKKEKTR